MDSRVDELRYTDGAKFFDKVQQHLFPRRDFELSTVVDVCPFVLRLTDDAESGLQRTEQVDVPEVLAVSTDAGFEDPP